MDWKKSIHSHEPYIRTGKQKRFKKKQDWVAIEKLEIERNRLGKLYVPPPLRAEDPEKLPWES